MVQLICRALGSESNAYLFFLDISRITMTNVFLYGNITTSRNSIESFFPTHPYIFTISRVKVD